VHGHKGCMGYIANAAGDTRVGYSSILERKAINDFITVQSCRVDTMQLRLPVVSSFV